MPWRNLSRSRYRLLLLLSISLLLMNKPLRAHANEPVTTRPQNASLEDSVIELQKQVRELQAAVREIHAEAVRYRTQVDVLQEELEATERKLDAKLGSMAPVEASAEIPGNAVDESNPHAGAEQQLPTCE